jgi:hypothetical protein
MWPSNGLTLPPSTGKTITQQVETIPLAELWNTVKKQNSDPDEYLSQIIHYSFVNASSKYCPLQIN